MSLSKKQLAMAWINSKLELPAISVDREELEALNGGEISDKLFDDATEFVKEELAKIKVRYAEYVAKYCSTTSGDETAI